MGANRFNPLKHALVICGLLALVAGGLSAQSGQRACEGVMALRLHELADACTNVADGELCYASAAVGVEPDHPLITREGVRQPLSEVTSYETDDLSVNVGRYGVARMVVSGGALHIATGGAVELTNLSETTVITQAATDSASAPATWPAQQFGLSTRRGDDCFFSTDGMMLYSTPGLVGYVFINGVQLAVDGAGFITAQDGNVVTVLALEGMITITAADTRVNVRPLESASVPVRDGAPTGPPSTPAFTDPGSLSALLNSLRTGEIYQSIDPASLVPEAGTWVNLSGTNQQREDCDNPVPTITQVELVSFELVLSVEDNGAALLDDQGYRYQRLAAGVYQTDLSASYGQTALQTIRVLAPERIELSLSLGDPECYTETRTEWSPAS